MTNPVAKARMLIRKPPVEVFQAFTDPAITTKFWMTKSSGKLTRGARVTWAWEMYGVSDEVIVQTFEPEKRVIFEWSFPQSNIVEWRFEQHADGTMMYVVNGGLRSDDVMAEVLNLTEGWNLVLAAAKAWLEHGINLNLVADKAPDAHVEGWR